MKYTRENLRGVGIESLNKEMSLKIIDKLEKFGINRGWTGSSILCYYGLGVDNLPECKSSEVTLYFNKLITFEEFMNESEIEENYEIY